MRRVALTWCVCVVLAVAVPRVGGAAGAEPATAAPEPVLLGPLTREAIEAALPSWVESQIEATPDYDAALGLVEELSGAEVTVFLGTWCSDSRRELSRLWRALDSAGLSYAPQFQYIGVDRSKKKPRELVAGSDLLYVPTFIVRRGGHEVGRIVEESPEGIESDLLALVSGERRGLLTTKTELLQGSDSEDR